MEREMSFDDCLEDKEETYACHCGGVVRKGADGKWSCDDCTFEAAEQDANEDGQ